MAAIHLSCLPRRLLAWLWAHEERFQGTRSASHQDLVQALGHDKGNLSPGAPGDRAAAGQWCIRLSEYPYCATRMPRFSEWEDNCGNPQQPVVRCRLGDRRPET